MSEPTQEEITRRLAVLEGRLEVLNQVIPYVTTSMESLRLADLLEGETRAAAAVTILSEFHGELSGWAQRALRDTKAEAEAIEGVGSETPAGSA